jgi:hypothetical protein
MKTFLKEYKPQKVKTSQFQFYYVRAFIRSLWFIGVREKGRRYYWKLFISSLFKRPQTFPMFISLAVYGYHFRKVVEKYIKTPIENTLGLQATEKSRGKIT